MLWKQPPDTAIVVPLRISTLTGGDDETTLVDGSLARSGDGRGNGETDDDERLREPKNRSLNLEAVLKRNEKS